MVAEVSHEEWVRRSRRQNAIIKRQQFELRQLRSNLRSLLKRVDRALERRIPNNEQDNDQ